MLPDNKIIDERRGKPKVFELMKHRHQAAPNELEKKQCERCGYDIAEKSWDAKLESMDGKETTKDASGRGQTLFGVEALRGRYDDMMGWATIWQ